MTYEYIYNKKNVLVIRGLFGFDYNVFVYDRGGGDVCYVRGLHHVMYCNFCTMQDWKPV